MPLLSDSESSVGEVQPLPCLPRWRWCSRQDGEGEKLRGQLPVASNVDGAVRDEDVLSSEMKMKTKMRKLRGHLA